MTMNGVLSFEQISEIFGGKAAAAVLLYLEAYESCYAKQIADAFKFSGSMVQKQLDKFQRNGLLRFEQVGRTKVYTFSPSNEMAQSLKIAARSALSVLSENDFLRFFNERRRPRREGKPLWINRKAETS